MKYTPELHSLALISTATAFMWVPYVLARMTMQGVLRAIGTSGPGYPTDPPWPDRARRAHVNAIENLAVFAPLVLVGAIIEVSTKATTLSPTRRSRPKSARDRDRGEPRGSAPPTPPYVRVRIRRFEKLR